MPGDAEKLSRVTGGAFPGEAPITNSILVLTVRIAWQRRARASSFPATCTETVVTVACENSPGTSWEESVPG